MHTRRVLSVRLLATRVIRIIPFIIVIFLVVYFASLFIQYYPSIEDAFAAVNTTYILGENYDMEVIYEDKSRIYIVLISKSEDVFVSMRIKKKTNTHSVEYQCGYIFKRHIYKTEDLSDTLGRENVLKGSMVFSPIETTDYIAIGFTEDKMFPKLTINGIEPRAIRNVLLPSGTPSTLWVCDNLPTNDYKQLLVQYE